LNVVQTIYIEENICESGIRQRLHRCNGCCFYIQLCPASKSDTPIS